MARKIRWGILGTGLIAHDVVQDFQFVPDAELVAVSARSQKSADSFADKYKIHKRYVGLEDMLSDPEIDIIYVATPHDVHKEHCLACFAAGKGVMCEKPFTVDAEEAKEVVSAARARDVFCMEAMWMRFIPAVQELKSQAHSGSIGKLLSLQADFSYPTFFDPKNRFFNLEMGGGALLDRGIYTVSLAQMLFGSPNRVSADATIGSTGVDEQSSYLLGYNSGAIATLSSSLRMRGRNDAVLMGEQGSLHLKEPFYSAERLTRTFSDQPTMAMSPNSGSGLKAKIKSNALLKRVLTSIKAGVAGIRGNQSSTHYYPGNGYQFEIQEATRCIQQGLSESPVMPLDESVDVMETLDRLRSSWTQLHGQDTKSTK